MKVRFLDLRVRDTAERQLLSRAVNKVLTHGKIVLGPEVERLIEQILKPHAWVKARLAQGMLAALEPYQHSRFLQQVCNEAAKNRIQE